MTHPAREFLTRHRPLHDSEAFARVESAAHDAATSPYSIRQPSEAQRLSSRYKKGEVWLHGLRCRIEQPRNTYREKVGSSGKPWRNRMAAHYGDLPGTLGADGDPLDIFIGPFPESSAVWVVNQRRIGTDALDEHKVMLGFISEQQAVDAYRDSYDRDWSGLMSIVPASVPQLRWWLKFGDKSRPFTSDQLPYEGSTMLDKVLWDKNAEPTTKPLHRLMYDLRLDDAKEGLLLDAVTMAELMEDPDIDGTMTFDAMVVEVGRLQQKMNALQRVMEAAGSTVKPLEMTISDPVKSRGVLQVMVLFTMSDGQTVSVWFHNPDTTPAKLMPLDELISWKWMLNKKDVTIVVAPERGRDLDVREVSRRLMRLVERNSDAFKKANAKAAERSAQVKALDDEIVSLEGELTDLQRKIEVAKVAREDADKSKAAEAAGAKDLGGTPAGIEAQPTPEPSTPEQLWAASSERERIAAVAKAGQIALPTQDWSELTTEQQQAIGAVLLGGPGVTESAGDGHRAGNENSEESAIAKVDAAYKFDNATDAFKEFVATSVNVQEYSTFNTAKKMDIKAKELGGSVSWHVSSFALDAVAQAAYAYLPEGVVLDFAGDVSAAIAQLEIALEVATNNEPINRERGDTEQADLERDNASQFALAISILKDRGCRVLDGAQATFDAANFPTVVGTITKGGDVIGRAEVAGNGKAMVWVGPSGDQRVKFESGSQAMWSDDDAELMVVALFTGTQADPAADDLETEPETDPAAAENAPMGNELSPLQPQSPERIEWENAVAEAVIRLANVSRGDAQAMLEADPDRLDKFWAGKSDPDWTAEQITGITPQAAAPAADPAKDADRAYLQTLIDGTADMLAVDIFDRLEPMFAKYEGDAEMMELLNRASMAYSNAAVAAAQQVLVAA